MIVKMAKIGLNLAVRGFFVVKFLNSYWLIRYGEFKIEQSSRPIKDLEPLLQGIKCTALPEYSLLGNEIKWG